MEFPNLGKHCNEDSCRRLDFLPLKCDCCSKVFCGEHYTYTSHNCPNAYKKNVQVPICPLCNSPVPGKADELPDIRVSRHIDNDCRSDTAVSRRQKVYSNKCSSKGCKKKEVVPILCDKCNLNYCLKHRHPQDHDCANINQKGPGKAGLAAMARLSGSGGSSKKHPPTGSSSVPNGLTTSHNYRSASLQGNLTEDQALQLALQASMNATSTTSAATSPVRSAQPLTQEQEDFLLAKAIAESEREAGIAGGPSSSRAAGRRNHPSCEIS